MEGIEEALYWHTVGIVTDSGNGLGTSVAIRWNRHCIFLTAKHVIETTDDQDLRFFFRPTGTVVRGDWGAPGIRMEPARPVPIFHRFLHPSVDVAALIVSPVLEKQVNVRFFDLRCCSKLLRPVSSVAAIGFPWDSKQDLTPNAAAIAACTLWGNLDHGKDWRPADFRPGSQLLLKFLPAEFGRHPGGFSGAGVWYHQPTPKPGVWNPNLALAGICTHYYRRQTLLLILRVERLADFLEKIAP
jgi:hypothetical protein